MSISLLITVVLLYTGWIVLCKLEEEEYENERLQKTRGKDSRGY